MTGAPASSTSIREDAPTWTRLGVIAGGGALPIHVAHACVARGAEPFIVGLKGWADADALSGFAHDWASIGEVGKILRLFKAQGCDAVTFAGIVRRPDFASLRVDWKGAQLLPRVLSAARKGDDALLRAIVGVFEDEGFEIVAAEVAARGLEAPLGALGSIGPSPEHADDIAQAFTVATALGAYDVGQGCVVCDGLVLALEAQEGTDAMLRRVADLPAHLRGARGAPRGVLAKIAKPGQERRVDLPVVGVSTVEGADRAGLAGIVVEAGGALILDRAAVAAAADAAGVFVAGVDVTTLAPEGDDDADGR